MAEQNKEFAPNAHYVGVEVAEGFKSDMEERQKILTESYTNQFTFEFQDIRQYEFNNCSLVTSIFTLQFMPMKDREEVIGRIYDGLNTGGAFIFSEKTVANNARIQEMMTFTFYDYKRKNFSTEDIMTKEVTLRNMLKPNTWNELEDMILGAGFRTVQPFWQNFLFVGAIALK
jgi:tRNA (cmo5U34)-methyltransferase